MQEGHLCPGASKCHLGGIGIAPSNARIVLAVSWSTVSSSTLIEEAGDRLDLVHRGDLFQTRDLAGLGVLNATGLTLKPSSLKPEK